MVDPGASPDSRFVTDVADFVGIGSGTGTLRLTGDSFNWYFSGPDLVIDITSGVGAGASIRHTRLEDYARGGSRDRLHRHCSKVERWAENLCPGGGIGHRRH